MREVVAEPLTAAAFAPFGAVITADGRAAHLINAGTAERIGQDAPDVQAQGGAACMAIFRTQAAGSMRLRVFERHCLGSQSFVPLGQGGCVVVVTSGDAAPDEAAIRAFVVAPGQGVTLHRGTWHHPLITLVAADVLVIERHAETIDCDVVAITGDHLVIPFFQEHAS